MSLPYCIRPARPCEVIPDMDDEPEIRVEKVLDIRRQLGEGRYDIEDRLDVVIDRIIQYLG
jgi:hypothetical protein